MAPWVLSRYSRTIRLLCWARFVDEDDQPSLGGTLSFERGPGLALPAVGLADTLTVDEAYVIGMTRFALMADARRAVYPMPLFRWIGGHGDGAAAEAQSSASLPLHPLAVDSRV